MLSLLLGHSVFTSHMKRCEPLCEHFGEFGGTLGVMPFFSNAGGRRGASCEVLIAQSVKGR